MGRSEVEQNSVGSFGLRVASTTPYRDPIQALILGKSIQILSFPQRILESNRTSETQIPVRNFYLLVIEDISSSEPVFSANGYFEGEHGPVFHTDHNPYVVSRVVTDKNKLHFDLVDRHGEPVRFDRAGYANSRNPSSTPRPAKRLVGEIVKR